MPLNQTMSHGRNLSAGESRQSFQVERKTLLSAYDRLEDRSNSEAEWTGHAVPPRARKAIPRPSSTRGWILLALVVIAASGLGAALSYYTSRCTIPRCVHMTSSYCKSFFFDMYSCFLPPLT